MKTLTGPAYEYPRPALTVDAVVFGYRTATGPDVDPLSIVLIQRGVDPFKGSWALPGGFVNVSDGSDQGEDLETAARRELQEEAAVSVSYLEQLYTFGMPGRDPRGRVVSVAYFGLVRTADHNPAGGDDAAGASWFGLSSPLVQQALHSKKTAVLAFDHDEIVRLALARLQAKVRYAPIGFNLLPPTFTLNELQRLYEAILRRPVDPRNFRRSILRMKILAESGTRRGLRHRPATLYRFDRQAYDRAIKQGFNFEL